MQVQTPNPKTKRYYFPFPVELLGTKNVVGVGFKARIRTRCSQSIGADSVADDVSLGLAQNTSIFPDVRRLSREPQRPGAARPLRLRDLLAS